MQSAISDLVVVHGWHCCFMKIVVHMFIPGKHFDLHDSIVLLYFGHVIWRLLSFLGGGHFLDCSDGCDYCFKKGGHNLDLQIFSALI